MSERAAPAAAPWTVRDVLFLLSRLVLGLFFLWMGARKSFDPVLFLKLIWQYRMVPESAYWLQNLMAAAIPWIEIFCGFLLILGVAVRGVATLLLLLLALFTAAVTIRALAIYATGQLAFCAIRFDCGCGAGVEYVCRKLPENLALGLLALLVLVSRSRRLCLKGDLVSR